LGYWERLPRQNEEFPVVSTGWLERCGRSCSDHPQKKRQEGGWGFCGRTAPVSFKSTQGNFRQFNIENGVVECYYVWKEKPSVKVNENLEKANPQKVLHQRILFSRLPLRACHADRLNLVYTIFVFLGFPCTIT
jgi:hypothetical protein